MPPNRQRSIACLVAASLLAAGLPTLAGSTASLRAQELQAYVEAAATKPKRNWFQRSNPATCTGAIRICSLFFEAEPSGRLVTLTNVSCTFRGVAAWLDTVKLLVVKKNGDVATTLALRPVAVDLAQVLVTRNFAINDDITAYVEAGGTVIVRSEAATEANSTVVLTCHIAGDLT